MAKNIYPYKIKHGMSIWFRYPYVPYKKTCEISYIPVRESVPKTKLNKGISTTLIDVI